MTNDDHAPRFQLFNGKAQHESFGRLGETFPTKALFASPTPAQTREAKTALMNPCRGPYCVMADDAVRLLRRRGRPACRLADGFPEWQRAQLPVEMEIAS